MKKISLFLFVCFITNFVSAQDYLITFSGSGESNTVGSVKVENLTQDKSLTINGNDVLHLKKVITAISEMNLPALQNIRFYPNPARDNSFMAFRLNEEGTAKIELFDISGRLLLQKYNYLLPGSHTYRFTGLGQGIYVVRITSGAQFLSGKLACEKSLNGNLGIALNKSETVQRNENDLKSTNAEIAMQYNTGDLLKYTGISGKYKTVITDTPIENKTIGFTFYSCTDKDGKDYSIVKIGIQWWMAENLQTIKYNDGSKIPNVKDNTAWAGLTTGAYCWYNNDAATHQNLGGPLYNGYAVITGKLCPLGWHVPNDDEWITLEEYLVANGYNFDGTTTGFKIAKSLAATKNWASSITKGAPGNTDHMAYRNKTGFSAFPGGHRNESGSFNNFSYEGLWWSSTEYAVCCVSSRYIFYSSTVLTESGFSKSMGSSVRCLRD